MKKENYTKCKWAYNTIAFALFFLFSYSANSQCTLACNNSVQVSLDNDCEVLITPDMVLEGQTPNGCNYTVEVLDLNDVLIPNSPYVNGDYIGQTLKARISESGNSCWGYLTIEDKLPPVINCPSDITLECYQINEPAPVVTANDNCDDVIIATVISDVITDLDCSNTFSASRLIIYGAEDASGNQAVFCFYTIYYARITISDLSLPLSWDNTPMNNPHIECGTNFPVIPSGPYAGNPDPSYTGAPEDPSGSSIFPNNTYCELNATFWDQVIPICEQSKKILRYWTILDWCTGEVVDHLQIIKIHDSRPPIVTCVPDFDLMPIPTSPYTCTADWVVLPPMTISDCTTTTWSLAYIFNAGNGNPPPNGIYYTDEITGTYPNFVLHNIPLGRNWLRYTIVDGCGNISMCFTEITVVDEVAPVPVCDQFTVATLSNNGWARVFATTFDDGSHDNCSDVRFGVRRMNTNCGAPEGTEVFFVGGIRYYDFVQFCCIDAGSNQLVEMIVIDDYDNYNTCMVEVNIQDKEDPYIICGPTKYIDCDDPIEFDTPLYGDNCGPPSISVVETDNRDNCGVGFVSRTWTVTDGGGRIAVCTQTIFIQNQTPFKGSDIDFPLDKLNLTGCIGANTDPSVLGYPTYNGDQCSLLAHTYTDQVFTFVDNACFKILRTWTVIDWCTYDGTNGIWSDVQIIKVSDDTNPVLTCNTAWVSITEECSKNESISIVAEDNCGSLVYDYQIVGGPSGSGNAANYTWPEGTHSIVWTVTDMCGNYSSCTQTVVAHDDKKPTPYCLGNITTVLMPTTMEIQIWAIDYDLGSFDNCDDNVTLSFSADTLHKYMTFDCSDLGVNLIQIWVTDNAGNQDYCETSIIIQDNNNVCGNMSRIAGSINSEMDDALENVEVMLDKMFEGEQIYIFTDDSGYYDFTNVVLNQDYEVSATKNDDFMNGVSTLDLVLIQKHLLNIEKFTSPYKVIAADINGSGSISAIDLIELRKLILGVYTELPSNGSWRFVDATQEFADDTHPWPFTEVISVEQLVDQDMGNDFIAVKIGDVDNSVKINAQSVSVENRTSGVLELFADQSDVVKGQVVNVNISSKNFSDIIGLQTTFTYNADMFDYVAVNSAKLDITDANLNTQTKGLISTSWNTVEGVTASDDEVLFTLSFRAKTNDYNVSLLRLSSELTNTEAYTTDLEVLNISLRGIGDSFDNEFEVYQNMPNPFSDYTKISFNLAEGTSVTLSIYDLNGRVIWETTRDFEKGVNSIDINNTDMNLRGVMYYRIDAGSNTATRKMISL